MRECGCEREMGGYDIISVEPTAPLSVIKYLIITTDRICIPKGGVGGISEHLVKTKVFLEC